MSRSLKLALGIVGFFILMALLGPFFLRDPQEYLGMPLEAPSAEFWLGTNGQGQDVLAQLVVGSRFSMFAAFLVGLLTSVIALGVGLLAAWWRGWRNESLDLFTQVFLLIPSLPLAILLGAYMQPGLGSLLTILVLTGWAWNARLFRTQALSLRERDFVTAARLMGETTFRILFWEILPHMKSLFFSVLLNATLYALAAQAGLEFLGLGDMGTISWGMNLFWAVNDAALLTESWWTFVPTGFCMATLAFSLAIINRELDAGRSAERDYRRLVPKDKQVPGLTAVWRRG